MSYLSGGQYPPSPLEYARSERSGYAVAYVSRVKSGYVATQKLQGRKWLRGYAVAA